MARDLRFLGWFVLVKLLVHIPVLGRYDFHRDELYFASAAAPLDWGYADFAPLVAWVAAMSETVFGDSVAALRVLPMLAGALTLALACPSAQLSSVGAFRERQ